MFAWILFEKVRNRIVRGILIATREVRMNYTFLSIDLRGKEKNISRKIFNAMNEGRMFFVFNS